MPLNIKDVATDSLARELAEFTGESITDAVKVALQERLARERRKVRMSGRRSPLQLYIDRGRARPTLDHRSADEILGYESDGLPQ